MDTRSLAIQIALGALVGFGFVTSSLGATLQYAGFTRPVALLVGVVAGFVVFLLVVLKAEDVKE